MQATQVISKTMALLGKAEDDNSDNNTFKIFSNLILRNPKYGIYIAAMLVETLPAQQVYYATVLSEAKKDWTSELYEDYYK